MLPILDVITDSTDNKPQRKLLKGLTHAQVVEITRLKLSTISSYPSKNKLAKGRGRTFEFNKQTRFWDEVTE